MRDEKGATFSISGVKDRVLVYGFIVLVGGGSVVNLAIPKHQIALTDSQGRELADNISQNRAEIKRINEWREQHAEWGSDLSAKSREQIADQNARINANSYLIKQCMRATGQ